MAGAAAPAWFEVAIPGALATIGDGYGACPTMAIADISAISSYGSISLSALEDIGYLWPWVRFTERGFESNRSERVALLVYQPSSLRLESIKERERERERGSSNGNDLLVSK